jgi:hypothetical protein
MNRMQNKSTAKVVNKSVETVVKFRYFGNKETNETYRHE